MQNAPVTHWGFKDVGLPPDKMKMLVSEMRAAGKITYLEVVSLSEEEGLRGARIAVGQPAKPTALDFEKSFYFISYLYLRVLSITSTHQKAIL